MRFSLIITLAVLLSVGTYMAALAADSPSANVTLPGATHSVQEKGPVALVANFYELAFFVAGILAFGAIVWGAIRRTLSAGNPSALSDANQWITSALLGILLLLGGYLILTTINPALKKLTLPEMEEPKGLPLAPGTAQGYCGVPDKTKSGQCGTPGYTCNKDAD